MIRAEDFVEAARGRGFAFYAGVPCSFLKPLINYVIGDDGLRYLSAANEGDAVAACAGAAIGGSRGVAMMQNSGLGNAVSPLASLTWVFRIPVLLIVTLRGDPELRDEPQHELMGRITARMLETLDVPWEFFPDEPVGIAPALERACARLDGERRPYAFVMRKGSVAPHALAGGRPAGRAPGGGRHERDDAGRSRDARPSRAEALARIRDATPEADTVVVATTGYTGRELWALDDRPNQLYMVGSMGCASSLGLGLSLVRDDLRVVVVDGDGAALMRMGNIATIGACGGPNLTHVVLDNEAHESTGGQDTVSRGVSFAGVAHACGYALAVEGDHLGVLDRAFGPGPTDGPRFAQLKTRPGTPADLPRPDVSPAEVRARLERHVARAGAAR